MDDDILEPIFSEIKSNVTVTQTQTITTPKTEPKEEVIPVKPPASKKVIRKKGSGFTPSINDALNGKFPEEKQQAEAKEIMQFYSGEELEEEFTKEQFEQKWNEGIQRYTDRPNIHAALTNTPEIKDKVKLILSIGSQTMDEEIRLIKPDLVSWLRKELRNTKLELITKIDVQKLKRVVYSDTEKLQSMINKNPNLNLLKQRFNLDFNE